MGVIFCEWEQDTNIDDSCSESIYDTSCDEFHCFEDGNIKDNNFKYCPYCGKLIIEVVK